MKFVLLTRGGSYFPSWFKRPINGPGVLNWVRIFNGEMKRTKDFDSLRELEKYDIVWINICGTDVGLVSEVASALGKDCSTKVVCNLDYAVEYFQHHMTSGKKTLFEFINDLASADLVVAQEPYQYKLIKYIVEENAKVGGIKPTKVALIPHPADTRIKKQIPEGAFIPHDQRLDILAVMYHRYDGQLWIPSAIVSNLQTKAGKPITMLLGYTGGPEVINMRDRLFDLIQPYTDWSEYIYLLAHCTLAFEYRTHHAHGRFAVECAMLGIPLVSNIHSYNSKILFPKTTFKPSQFKEMRDTLIRLMEDPEFYEEVWRYAYEKVDEWGYDHKKKELLQALEEAEKK